MRGVRVIWEVEQTDEFEVWWDEPDIPEQEDTTRGSRHGRMRELRIQHRGRPYRILYAFDPGRVALLLIGGDKTGNDDWYDEFVPIADNLYDEHLETLKAERNSG